jgi:hypothetical protein
VLIWIDVEFSLAEYGVVVKTMVAEGISFIHRSRSDGGLVILGLML